MRIFLLKKGDLSNALGSSSNSFDELDDIFTTKLNKNAPKEKELIGGIVSVILTEIYVGP